jgi:hypothetical protein
VALSARDQALLRYAWILLVVLWPGSEAVADTDLAHILDNNPDVPTLSEYGGVGLLDMRTARFLPDGTVSISGVIKNPDDRIAATFQALPWLETTFRWAHDYGIETIKGQGSDRSFDVKFRLWQESNDLPQFAIGLQDFIGSGIYSGEYAVASKAWGDLDFTLGMGWGRLASNPTFENPLGFLSKSFLTRSFVNGQGGSLHLDYFHGQNVGIFGGVEYSTPIRNLKLQVEYSSDAYKAEIVRGPYVDIPYNFGLTYRPYPGIEIGVSYMYGREIGVRLSLFGDPTSPAGARLDPQPPFTARDPDVVDEVHKKESETEPAKDEAWRTHFYDLTQDDTKFPNEAPHADAGAQPQTFQTQHLPAPEPQAPANNSAPSEPAGVAALPAPVPPSDSAPAAVPNAATPQAAPILANSAAIDKASDDASIATMRDAIMAQSIIVEGPKIEGNRVRVIIQNDNYLRDAEAVSRVVRALSSSAPAHIEDFEIITTRNSMPITTLVVPRSEVDKLANHDSSPEELLHATDMQPGPTVGPVLSQSDYPVFDYMVYPSARQSLFDPNNPFYFSIGAGVNESVSLGRGLALSATEYFSIYNTFGNINRASDSVLPHVRSDLASYLKDGQDSLESTTAAYYFKMAPEVYARVTAGYLEQMFAGLGGEVYYRPFDKRWSIGADLWGVQQRGFDQLLDLRPYKTITGHMTLYYDSPWYDIDFALHAGRYLAGDYGATLEVSRTFSTGWEIGAWVTLTNVPFSKFGEGSFDKGIIIRIPLEWGVPIGSQSVFAMNLRPVQRDGGQRLDDDTELYDLTKPSSLGELQRQWDSVFDK